jgi:hypothetical protein
MTIRRTHSAAPPTEADAGKYAVRDTVWRNGFCSRPVLITKVNKSRVYYLDSTRVWQDKQFKVSKFEIMEGAIEQFCKTTTIRFVCDTFEEAVTLHDLSEQQNDELNKTDKEIREKYNMFVEKLLTK